MTYLGVKKRRRGLWFAPDEPRAPGVPRTETPPMKEKSSTGVASQARQGRRKER